MRLVSSGWQGGQEQEVSSCEGRASTEMRRIKAELRRAGRLLESALTRRDPQACLKRLKSLQIAPPPAILKLD